MKKNLRTAVLMLSSLLMPMSCVLAQEADDVAPAFPGAEGHGRYVTGGRKADGTTNVYHVTSLGDSNTKGTLRWALSQSGPRTIVFDVSGYIDLTKDLTITSNTTIAGQTAPEPGITLRYYTVRHQDNVIVRFVRFRRSQVKDVNDGADATWERNRTGIMLDHCSFSWSIDEVASFYDNNNFTMQWCSLGESLLNAGHGKGAHGYGGIWGGKLASFHHNMISHVANRGPRFCGARYNWTGYTKNKLYSKYGWKNAVQAENVDFRCCVTYNAGNTCYGGPGGGQINIVNNYYKSGPAKTSAANVTQVTVAAEGNSSGQDWCFGLTSRYFINGNTVYYSGSAKKNRDWDGVTYDDGTYYIDKQRCCADPKHYYGEDVTYLLSKDSLDCVPIKMTEPAPTGLVTTHSAEQTYENVLSYVGACLWRDAVDARYVEECRTGTATYTGEVSGRAGLIDLITHPDSVEVSVRPSFPKLDSQVRPDGYDTDGDGMPDEWETAHGLNPKDASDKDAYTLDTEKGWYSNLEVYLNSLVEDIMKAGNADALTGFTEYYPPAGYFTSSLGETKVSSEVVGFEYYDLKGNRLAQPGRGISVRRTIFSDGRSESDLVIRKE